MTTKFTLVNYDRKIEIVMERNPYSRHCERIVATHACDKCGQSMHDVYEDAGLTEPRFHWAVYPNPEARRIDLGFHGLTLSDRELAMFLKAYKNKGYEISHD